MFLSDFVWCARLICSSGSWRYSTLPVWTLQWIGCWCTLWPTPTRTTASCQGSLAPISHTCNSRRSREPSTTSSNKLNQSSNELSQNYTYKYNYRYCKANYYMIMEIDSVQEWHESRRDQTIRGYNHSPAVSSCSESALNFQGWFWFVYWTTDSFGIVYEDSLYGLQMKLVISSDPSIQ